MAMYTTWRVPTSQAGLLRVSQYTTTTKSRPIPTETKRSTAVSSSCRLSLKLGPIQAIKRKTTKTATRAITTEVSLRSITLLLKKCLVRLPHVASVGFGDARQGLGAQKAACAGKHVQVEPQQRGRQQSAGRQGVEIRQYLLRRAISLQGPLADQQDSVGGNDRQGP